LQNAKEEHDIHAVFTQGNHEGWIYLKTTMSCKTMDLLHITLGILHMNQRVYSNAISIEDQSTTLRLLQKGNENLKLGHWVCVLRGTYCNDIGWVWGERLDGHFHSCHWPVCLRKIPLRKEEFSIS